MSASTKAEQLRATARQLRFVSSRINRSLAITVYRYAGADTWIGPTAQSCYEALFTMHKRLQENQRSAADTARRLERQADVLEQQSTAPGTV